MAMDLLRQIASKPLPATFHTPAEIDKVKLLRAAGLMIALTPAPANPLTLSGPQRAAQVLAITQRGREELAEYSLPGEHPPGSSPPLLSQNWKVKRNAASHDRPWWR